MIGGFVSYAACNILTVYYMHVPRYMYFIQKKKYTRIYVVSVRQCCGMYLYVNSQHCAC